ncbi:MAG: exodeoxyribonuclease VII small subunit [Firmicutes bacterium]|nr:exodeoxyribonuclease VII small subunit [Bacillota bacterium]
MDNKLKDIPFEKAIEDLESVVKKLEEGNLSLDDSLKYFKKGIELYKHCNNTLENAEGKVKLILENENKVEEVQFKESE